MLGRAGRCDARLMQPDVVRDAMFVQSIRIAVAWTFPFLFFLIQFLISQNNWRCRELPCLVFQSDSQVFLHL